MAKADHIHVRRRAGYTHHGIDCGDGTVIHYSGEPLQKSSAVVCRTDMETFLKGGRLQIRSYSCCDNADAVISRAKSRLGQRDYALLSNNCEHFAEWCKTGCSQSEQVDSAKAAGKGTAGTSVAAAGALSVVSRAGVVAGTSGPGVMSGLARVGGTVGCGAAAGIVIVGQAPALLANCAMHQVLKDDPKRSDEERDARKAGRVASTVGSAAGGAAAIGAVSTMGTVSGLSGAGLTSGLAAVGGTFGGGMAAGVVVTALAPAAATAAIGYGVYRLWNAL